MDLAPLQLRVLVADDDRDAVMSLLELLREEGHEVRGVYTGLDVLDSVRLRARRRAPRHRHAAHHVAKPYDPNALLALLKPLRKPRLPPARNDFQQI